MKKILLLGGSAQQVIAVKTAKRLGYYTILCDFLTDNPGQYVADKFYLESTTDKEKILEIAKSENIDGILAYASDPAAPTAAYVAEKRGLPGNSYKAVDILCNKDKFRKFLKESNFNTPRAKGYTNIEGAYNDLQDGMFAFPVIVKPVDSSGSKGITVLYSNENSENAINFAFDFSRSKKIVIEEFIEKNHPYLIGGDIHIVNGKVILWGLLNCHRDEKANPLVPVGKSYPLEISEQDKNAVCKTLQEIVTALHIKNGPMNVELVVDKKGQVWPIDVGPRNGGNMIPDLLGNIFNIDIVELTIQGAMGYIDSPQITEVKSYYATYNLHSIRGGNYKEIIFSKELEKYIIRKALYKKEGDKIEFFDNAAKALGIIFLKFDSKSQMVKMLENINNHITLVYK